MKKKLLTLLQLAIGAGLITFFFINIAHSGKLGEFKNAMHSAAGNWQFLAAGILAYILCILLCTTRWVLLLKAQNVSLGFPRALVLYFIGLFFSSFMPGSTSGDIIKAIYVAREVPDKKTEVVSTVFIDRIIGLVGLLILAVVTMIFRFQFFLSYPQTRIALGFNITLLLGSIVGFFVIFRHNILEKWSFFSRMEGQTRLGKIITKAYSAFHACINHPGVLWKTIAISTVNHVVFILCSVLLGTSLGINMSVLDYLTVFPVINAFASIPFTPGGLGMREGAAIFLLGALNVSTSNALAVSLLIYTSTLFWSLIGGIIYIIFVYKTGYDARKEMEAVEE